MQRWRLRSIPGLHRTVFQYPSLAELATQLQLLNALQGVTPRSAGPPGDWLFGNLWEVVRKHSFHYYNELSLQHKICKVSLRCTTLALLSLSELTYGDWLAVGTMLTNAAACLLPA